MSQIFTGFSTQRNRSVGLPIEVFTEVLSTVQDLSELKVLLTVFRRVAARRDWPKGWPRAVSWEELCQDEILREGLAILGQDMSPEERLDRALEKAVARGTLLHLVAHRGGHAENWYLVNTVGNRRWVKELGEGQARLAGTPLEAADAVAAERPTIFQLYEQNIGVITPMLAEELEEAGRQYDATWIEDAFREAVAHNARSWRYVQSILQRWAREGRGEPRGRRERPIDFDEYTRGEFADLFGKQQGPPQEEPDETGRS